MSAIGRALEDVLKRTYVDLLGLDPQNLKKKNGISELGNYLYSQKLIHNKQYQIIMAQGNIRNMGSHGKEVVSMEKWDITSTGAMGKLFSTLALIKSLFHYVEYDEFLF